MSAMFTPAQWKDYFASHPIPVGLELYIGIKITDPKTFLATQINLLEHYGNAGQGKLGLDRLIRVKEILEGIEAS